jgi:phosphoribosylformylglycinamidine cyclo-ligase
MPGMYQSGEYDVAGTIVGVVDRPKMLDGSKIKRGDVIIGLRGNGLHTNGYSLARKVLLEKMRLPLDKPAPGMTMPLGKELLKVHPNYQPLMASLPQGMLARRGPYHRGGLLDNLPRVLPEGCLASISKAAWKVPTIFNIIQNAADIPDDEMFQVFNMGIGMTLIVPPSTPQRPSNSTKRHPDRNNYRRPP